MSAHPLKPAAAAAFALVALPAAATPTLQAEREALQARVEAVRAALAEDEPEAGFAPIAQTPNWTNWPKWTKWANWANK